MDGFTEKKWFVYIGDQHQGPFSLSEIQGKMGQGEVKTDSFVWADGMPDWKAMTDVPEFLPLLSGTSPTVEPIAPEPQFIAPTLAPVLEATSEAVSGVIAEPLVTATIAAEPVAPSFEDKDTGPLDLPSQPKKTAKNLSPKVLRWVATGLVVIGLGVAYQQGLFASLLRFPAIQAGMKATSEKTRPYLLKLAEKVPALSPWISPIPSLEDTSPEEYEDLKRAAREPLSKGPQFSLALSRSDELAPAFYLSSNVADGTVFKLWIVGVPETLLNQTSSISEATVTLRQHLGKTEIIRFPDGRPIPRGNYLVLLTSSDGSPINGTNPLPVPAEVASEISKETKILAAKQYFLGGARDSMYLTRLSEFHDKLREKAATELTEIKQFCSTLESQLASTETKFGIIKKGKITQRQRKAWESFHNEWMNFQGQLDQIFIKWTPESLKADYFYSPLYLLVLQVGQSVEKVHEFHHSFFNGTRDPKTFEIQLGEASSSALTSVNLLKAKIEQTEKLAPSPNGMPRKEGL